MRCAGGRNGNRAALTLEVGIGEPLVFEVRRAAQQRVWVRIYMHIRMLKGHPVLAPRSSMCLVAHLSGKK